MNASHLTSSRKHARLQELADVLDRDWDTDFDPRYDDLEREFAELRFHMCRVE